MQALMSLNNKNQVGTFRLRSVSTWFLKIYTMFVCQKTLWFGLRSFVTLIKNNHIFIVLYLYQYIPMFFCNLADFLLGKIYIKYFSISSFVALKLPEAILPRPPPRPFKLSFACFTNGDISPPFMAIEYL